ncbi:hypothetical protein P9112_008200 [Eukaryota sp. TZLM1-RC]
MTSVEQHISPSPQEVEEHPLHRSWTLYFTAAEASKDKSSFENTMRNLITFSTAEKFVSILKALPKTSDYKSGSSLQVFEADVKPTWEDPNNANGGRYKYSLPSFRGNESEINQFVDNILMFLVGEQFGELGDLITGIYILVKRGSPRVDIWLRSCDDVEAIKQIAEILIDQCDVKREHLVFTPHHPNECDAIPGGKLKF